MSKNTLQKKLSIRSENGCLFTDDLNKVNDFLSTRSMETISEFWTLEEIYEGAKDSIYWEQRSWDWKINAPKIKGFIGPMKDGNEWAYMSNDAYQSMCN